MIIAEIKDGAKTVYTKSAYQFDKKQLLKVTGIELPEAFEVHISNNKDGGSATAISGNQNGVYIPDNYFADGNYVYVWIYSINEMLSKQTVYSIIIPVIRRSAQLPVTHQ